MSTPIQKLDNKSTPIQQKKNPAHQFAVPPAPGFATPPVNPVNLGQSVNPALYGPASGSFDKIKELFSGEKFDWKYVLIVFVILLIITNNTLISFASNKVPLCFDPTGKLTLIGSVLISIIGSLLFGLSVLFIESKKL